MTVGRVINYNQIKFVPGRNEYLDQTLVNHVAKQVTAGKSIRFMPNDVEEVHLQDKKYQKAKYKIILHGVLEGGKKSSVIIDGIQPYFVILLSDEDPEREAARVYAELCGDELMTPLKYSMFEAKPFMLYQENTSPYAKIIFGKTKTRRKALDYLREKDYYGKTYSDDLTCYYRMWSRDNEVPFTRWLIITDFSTDSDTSLKELTIRVNEKNIKAYDSDITKEPNLAKDCTMSMTWDIETNSVDESLPLPHQTDSKTFMICMTFQWHWAKETLLRVCLVDKQCDPLDDALVVICKSEEELFKGFGKFHESMRPDLVIGFNDSDYDWKWLIERGITYPGTLTRIANCMSINEPWKKYTDDSVYRFNCRNEKIKMEAGTYADGISLRVPGALNLDVRTLFRQIYPTAEKTTLAWFLSKNKLGGKVDMPYKEMFAIERNATNLKSQGKKADSDAVAQSKADMAEVAQYCIIDAFRCHELFRIRNILGDRREVAAVSFTSLFDAFFRANGSKVCNLLFAEGKHRGLVFSNISQAIIEDGKYPGAYVLTPETGLIAPKLSIPERIARARALRDKGESNPHDEWLSLSENAIADIYDAIAKHGAVITKKNIKVIEDELGKKFAKCAREFLIENIGRPITGLDFSSLYPSLIMCYNLSPEFIILKQSFAKEMSKKFNLHRISFPYNGRKSIGWSIRHDGLIDPDDPNCRFGIVPMVLKKLFDKRKGYKKILHKWESRKEEMETLADAEFKDVEEEYDDVCFNFNYWDSKQKALKVFMNTFYGQMGNKISPIFLLQIAGGITAMGQFNLKAAQAFVETLNCHVKYGDTDSIYLSVPEKHFDVVDRDYYTSKISKLEYMKTLVAITFVEIKSINAGVNEWFFVNNGTRFLRMAYEEAIYPGAFLAKKKYYGIAHISIPNFSPKTLFIKGLEAVKRGISPFLRKACMAIMWESVSVNNIWSLLDLVYSKVDEVYETEWDFTDFIKTAVYKPKKKNIAVQTFAARMLEQGTPVKPHERFSYVIVRKYPSTFNTRGCKKELSVGDRMEHVEVAREEKMPIDKDYYVKGGLVGQLARLIVYHSNFVQVPDDDSDEAIKVASDKTFKVAKKHMENYCKAHYATYSDKGVIYKRIFRQTNKIAETILSKHVDPTVAKLMTSNYDIDSICKWISDMAEKASTKEYKGHGKRYVSPKLDKCETADEKRTELERLSDKYYSGDSNVENRRELQFSREYARIRDDLESVAGSMRVVFASHQAMINHMTQVVKDQTGIDDMYNQIGDQVPDLNDIPGFEGVINSDKMIEVAESDIQKLMSSKEFTDATESLSDIHTQMKEAFNKIIRVRTVVDHLKFLRNQSNGIFSPNFDKKTMIRGLVEENMN